MTPADQLCDAIRREVATGSWLGQPFQRFGTEMRIAVLILAFEHLRAMSDVVDRAGRRVLAERLRLAADADARRDRPAVTVSGVDDEVLGMCGAHDPTGHEALPLGGFPHAPA